MVKRLFFYYLLGKWCCIVSLREANTHTRWNAQNIWNRGPDLQPPHFMIVCSAAIGKEPSIRASSSCLLLVRKCAVSSQYCIQFNTASLQTLLHGLLWLFTLTLSVSVAYLSSDLLPSSALENILMWMKFIRKSFSIFDWSSFYRSVINPCCLSFCGSSTSWLALIDNFSRCIPPPTAPVWG